METRTLKTLVSLRHGRDVGGSDASAVLSEKGIRDVKETSLNIADWINGRTLVLTSPIIRAKQTADIIVAALSADLVVLDSLRNDEAHMGRGCKSQIMKEVEKNGGYDNIVVATHYQLVNGIVLAFKEDFPQIDFDDIKEPLYGHGFIVDIETGNVENV